jgi:hypothetical protein
MAKPIKRHLKVGYAPADDEGALIIRMHPEDLPKGMKWTKYIHLLVNDERLTCRVRNNELVEVPQPRVHQININNRLRELLGIKSGTVYDFYVTKASSLKAPYYVLRYHPDRVARRNMVFKVCGAVTAICAIIGGTSYYFVG